MPEATCHVKCLPMLHLQPSTRPTSTSGSPPRFHRMQGPSWPSKTGLGEAGIGEEFRTPLRNLQGPTEFSYQSSYCKKQRTIRGTAQQTQKSLEVISHTVRAWAYATLAAGLWEPPAAGLGPARNPTRYSPDGWVDSAYLGSGGEAADISGVSWDVTRGKEPRKHLFSVF